MAERKELGNVLMPLTDIAMVKPIDSKLKLFDRLFVPSSCFRMMDWRRIEENRVFNKFEYNLLYSILGITETARIGLYALALSPYIQ